MTDLSVFIAESVNANDFYIGQTDGFAANEVLKIQRVRSLYRIVFDKRRLRQAIRDAHAGDFKFFHLSCHGNSDGIRLTDGTDIDWLELATMFGAFANENRMLVMSSCAGAYVDFSKALQKRNVRFGYIFGSTETENGVGFTDSCIAWSVLYNGLADNDFDRSNLRATLDKINHVVPGDFVYRRWNGKKYLAYPLFT